MKYRSVRVIIPPPLKTFVWGEVEFHALVMVLNKAQTKLIWEWAMLKDMEDRAKDAEAKLEVADGHILNAENCALIAENGRTTLENAAKRAQLDAEMSKVVATVA